MGTPRLFADSPSFTHAMLYLFVPERSLYLPIAIPSLLLMFSRIPGDTSHGGKHARGEWTAGAGAARRAARKFLQLIAKILLYFVFLKVTGSASDEVSDDQSSNACV